MDDTELVYTGTFVSTPVGMHVGTVVTTVDACKACAGMHAHAAAGLIAFKTLRSSSMQLQGLAV